jgi:hypothetical protein
VTHTRPLSPIAVRLAPFAIVGLPVGPARQIGAKFAELAVDLDEMVDLGGLAADYAVTALEHLGRAFWSATEGALNIEAGR